MLFKFLKTNFQMQASAEQPVEPVVKYVLKRDGKRQPLNLEKIRSRFVNKGTGLNLSYINFDVIVQKVAEGIYQGKYCYPRLTTLFAGLHLKSH